MASEQVKAMAVEIEQLKDIMKELEKKVADGDEGTKGLKKESEESENNYVWIWKGFEARRLENDNIYVLQTKVDKLEAERKVSNEREKYGEGGGEVRQLKG